MESVQARQQGSQDFEGYYKQLCALQNTCPLTGVKVHLAEGVLDLNGDRIRAPDWAPILNALRINKSLRFVGIRSYYQHVIGCEDFQDGKPRSRVKRRPPPIRSKEVIHHLCVALGDMLSVSQAVTHIELQGIPLRIKDIQLIAKVIVRNSSLQHLSLESCRVGDRSVEKLCQGIKHSSGITSLNLSGCGLTSQGAESLAKLVKHQSMQRHSEAWKDSLRYRRPDLDRMAGIRRITLNQNPLVNDDGAVAFAEVLKDDLWLKALDMQHCGISNLGAKALLDSLHQNSSIVVLDIRKNHLVDRDVLKAVMKQVLINAGGEENEYKWLRVTSSREHGPHGGSKPRRRTKTLNSSFGRKTTIRVTSGPSSAPNRPRSKSSGGDGISVHVMRVNREPEVVVPAVTKPGPGFVPWRTAARASQRRIHTDEHQNQVDSSPSSTPSKSAASIHVHAASMLSSGELDTSSKDTGTPATMMSSIRDLGNERGVADQRMMREMQIEIEELHRRLYIESRARAAADARVVELEVANSRLQNQVQLLQARSPASPLRRAAVVVQPAGPQQTTTMNQLEDESVLDSIEESFAKFHGFLDLLREAGLGQLCTLVGTSPEEIRNPQVRSILQQHQPTAYKHYPMGLAPLVSHYAPQPSYQEPRAPHETQGTLPSAEMTDIVSTSADAHPKSRQVIVHAPLVPPQEQDSPSQSDSVHVQTETRNLPAVDSRPVVLHPPLLEPLDRTTESVLAAGRQPQTQQQTGADLDQQNHADFDKELEKPHIEFTGRGTGSSGDAGIKRPTDEATDRARTHVRAPVIPEPQAEDTKQQQHSDQELSGHSLATSHSHSHRTSTPVRSKDTPPASDHPASATYSIDEDHESLGSPVPEELDGSSEDLFMDLPRPSKGVPSSKPGNNNDKGFRGDDEYSSDEDF
ncbi:centrosomal protein of 78 kDa-like [Acanthaster planci]|uniref:Centrosomal protein of 78 kDa-like n=1 Tax=Acanthaster planci TaxID=133434 RepID=A0A8B7Y1L6_ACAPL|nr:centrosomal protein of 78 kDa-like [Acanthaster planci]XP_022087059.1 centrosomal protein of 78 kDa-like [Acanthaster planci]XP_022087060.1 centrosomal protein of 78 kDa-like [Acanthaster planci]